ncbi:hypothetical protein ACFXGI_27475 [Streptomyces sp. NPDC059355]|uniref:hypothetical protein n=1 Tax=Streptomyces sp. NPDC059355 TaxID=3346811 RepID=UPI0036BA7921
MALPLLHALVRYRWILEKEAVLGGVGTAVAVGLGIAAAAGMFTASTRVHD